MQFAAERRPSVTAENNSGLSVMPVVCHQRIWLTKRLVVKSSADVRKTNDLCVIADCRVSTPPAPPRATPQKPAVPDSARTPKRHRPHQYWLEQIICSGPSWPRYLPSIGKAPGKLLVVNLRVPNQDLPCGRTTYVIARGIKKDISQRCSTTQSTASCNRRTSN